MADDQDTQNDDGDQMDYDGNDPTTTTAASVIQDAGNSIVDDYGDEEPLEDFTVNLFFNDLPDGVIPTDAVRDGLTDIYGQEITSSTTPLMDLVNEYTAAITQGVVDEIQGNSTAVAEKKQWWGTWSWLKILFIVLIALCIIGIILSIVFMILGKKFKKKKQANPPSSSATTRALKSAGPAPDTKYGPL
jgi:uncharacterized protein YneF (UPF0154 family)